MTVERMELDAQGFPQPTGETETLAADTVILALGQESDLSLVEGVAGVEVADGVVSVGPDMMTGHPGVFAGGDMVPERTVTTGRRPRPPGRTTRRRVAARHRARPGRAPAHRGLRRAEHLVLRGRPARQRPRLEARPRRAVDVRRGRRRPRRGDRALRGEALPVVRQLLRMRQLLRRLPRQRGHQARPGQGFCLRPRLLQGLRHLRRGVPRRGHRDVPRRELTVET